MENDSPVNELLARLSQHHAESRQQKQTDERSSNGGGSSSATDPFANNTPPTESVTSDGRPDAAEFLRLQKDLEFTRERMAQMELELTQSRIARHTVEEAIGSPFPAAQQLAYNIGSGAAATQGRASPYRAAPPPQGNNAPPSLWVDTGVQPNSDMYTPQL
jgi:hypothetical protein